MSVFAETAATNASRPWSSHFSEASFPRRGTNGPFGMMFLILSNGPLVPLDPPDASVGSRRDIRPKGIMTAPTVSATAGNDGDIPPVHGGGNSPPDGRRWGLCLGP